MIDLSHNNISSYDYELFYEKMPNIKEIVLEQNCFSCDFFVSMFNYYRDKNVSICISSWCDYNETLTYIDDICPEEYPTTTENTIHNSTDLSTDYLSHNNISSYDYELFYEKMPNIKEIVLEQNCFSCDFFVSMFNYYRDKNVSICISSWCDYNETLTYIDDICPEEYPTTTENTIHNSTDLSTDYKISAVKTCSFIGLGSLEVLDLVRNNFERIEYSYFGKIENLQILWLNKNSFSNFNINYKSEVQKYLVALDLSPNNISSYDYELFYENMPNIKEIVLEQNSFSCHFFDNLSHNNISSYDYELFYEKMPNMKEIVLEQNCFSCDFFVSMFNYYRDKNVSICISSWCDYNETLTYIDDICPEEYPTTTENTIHNSTDLSTDCASAVFIKTLLFNDVICNIKQHPDTCKIHNMFTVSSPCSDVRIPAHKHLEFIVTYKPIIPNYRSLEIYEYTDSDLNSFYIILKGEAIGPRCNISTKIVFFHKKSMKQRVERIVEIKNNSSVEAAFKFDTTCDDVFQISPVEGTISKRSYQHFKVKFDPQKKGIFFSQFFCLIWNTKPLLLETIGCYGEELDQTQLETLTTFNFPINQTFGYGAYLNDHLTKRKDTPPFSLSSNFIDFGQLEEGVSITTTSFTNHLKEDILVEWYQGQDIFQIIPKQVKVSGGSCVQFECHFRPKQRNQLYAETLMAQVRWKDEIQPDKPTRPLPCFLKVQGHSFLENEGWIAPAELAPENIVLPSCLPGETATATLKLVNRTHLPVMYKLEPPFRTNVTAKPMVGKFHSIEIIVIQLQTNCNQEKNYIEEWKLILNGDVKNTMIFYIAGEAKTPSVEIGTNNKIEAGIIQEGCEFKYNIPIKNKCDFCLSYKFQFHDGSRLMILPPGGTLFGNDIQYVDLYIKGNACQETEKFTCITHLMDTNGAVVGEAYTTEVELTSNGSYSELCAIPSELDLGIVQHGSKIYAEFEAFNFGDSTVYFHSHYNAHSESTRVKYFEYQPCFGEVCPKSSITFIINGTAKYDGPQVISFGYYNRVSKYSSMLYGNKVNLFKITYTCDYPTVQIDDIVEHNFGCLFGKNHFYDNFLYIPRINDILNTLTKNSEQEINLRLPECQMQSKEFYIILSLSNKSRFETEIALKRHKLCDCDLKEIAYSSFHQRKKEFNCPHREMVTLELSNDKIGVRFSNILMDDYCIVKNVNSIL
ncbi:uncharacterized protein LOC143190797 [Rhynchophorus ferrugineus]|uniref:uncharacterized protein LOC143190797 n=1 Tax=Rhynchophorus ferrugineus TaxID=354439 RepID=UPI003FCC706B